MADGEITIRIPGASPPIPEVVIRYFPGQDDDYTISTHGLAAVEEFSAIGTPIVTGEISDRYIYAVTCYQLQEDALRLAAIARWSSDTYKAGNDGHLEMDFELQYIDPEPSPHSRALVNTLTTPYGYEYGFPRLNVVLTLGQDYRKKIGCLGNQAYMRFQFAATEV